MSRVHRRPQAQEGLFEIALYIARGNPAARLRREAPGLRG